MSIENRMVGSAASLSMSMAAAFQSGIRSAPVDDTGEEAYAILANALVDERLRRHAVETALDEAREEIAMLREALDGRA
jgi:hypothetical protein